MKRPVPLFALAAALLSACHDPADRLAGQSDTGATITLGQSAALTGCPGAGYIFWGDFSSDVVGQPPGAPNIGKWTMNQAGGRVRVVASSGNLTWRPVQLTRTSSGVLSLLGKACMTPTDSTVTAAWYSLVSSSTIGTGTFTLRDPNGLILASLQYRPVGALAYNGTVLAGVTWTRYLAQAFEIEVNLVTRRTSLAISGSLVASNKKYVDPSASPADRVELDLTGNDAAMAMDSLRIHVQP